MCGLKHVTATTERLRIYAMSSLFLVHSGYNHSMSQELDNLIFSVSSNFINKVILLAIDKARVDGKEIPKNDYYGLSKILNIGENELRKIVMKPQSLTIRQAVKLAQSLGMGVELSVRGNVGWY